MRPCYPRLQCTRVIRVVRFDGEGRELLQKQQLIVAGGIEEWFKPREQTPGTFANAAEKRGALPLVKFAVRCEPRQRRQSSFRFGPLAQCRRQLKTDSGVAIAAERVQLAVELLSPLRARVHLLGQPN